jgi:hypothetical protein
MIVAAWINSLVIVKFHKYMEDRDEARKENSPLAREGSIRACRYQMHWLHRSLE